MSNTYFVLGRKVGDAPPEFVWLRRDDNTLCFTLKLLSAWPFTSVEKAMLEMRNVRPRDKAGVEVLEVLARKRKSS